MAYFRDLSIINYSLILLIVASPLVYVFSEQGDVKSKSKIELTSENEMTDVNYKITIESANTEKISIVSDGVFIGWTPYTLFLREGDRVNLQCVSKDGRVLLNTIVEGGKSPQRILILPPKRDTYWKDVAMGILGVSIGVGIGLGLALLFSD